MDILRGPALAVAAAIVASSFLWSATASADARPFRGDLPVESPWLREHLPENAVFYARMPNLTGLLTMPKGNALDAALRSRTNVENVLRLREGIANNIIGEMPEATAELFRALNSHLRSPLEIGVNLYPAPSMLVSAETAFERADDVERFFATLAAEYPLLALASSFNDGFASLANLPYPGLVHFDAEAGRLLFTTGPAVTMDRFAALTSEISRPRSHLMHAMETRLDESGQGMFVWFDTEQALPLLQSLVQPEDLQPFMDLGLDKVAAVAMGWGVANGKSRLGVVAELPAGESRDLVPIVENDVTARSVGDPDGMMLLSLPSAGEFSRLESSALSRADAADHGWFEAKQANADISGIEVEEFFAALGPEVLFIFDSVGDYIAVRLRNRRLWNSIVERLEENTAVQLEERRIDGARYYHFMVPSATTDEDGNAAAAELGWLGDIVARQRDHFYWVQDGDYLYVATLPQPLIDRQAARARTDVGDWLDNRQRVDSSDALFAISGETRKVPRRFYEVYLELIQLLGDLALADVDLWSMPTARQLDLPDVGGVSFSLAAGSPLVSAELVFENNPLEFLGGAGGIVALGVVAGVAIPAYQDYTTRAAVSQGLLLSADIKSAVAEYYATHGRFPDAEAAEALSIFEADEYVRTIVVEADTGAIVIDYTEDVTSAGEQVFLDPEVQEDGAILWTCSGTFPDKSLPAACRP